MQWKQITEDSATLFTLDKKPTYIWLLSTVRQTFILHSKDSISHTCLLVLMKTWCPLIFSPRSLSYCTIYFYFFNLNIQKWPIPSWQITFFSPHQQKNLCGFWVALQTEMHTRSHTSAWLHNAWPIASFTCTRVILSFPCSPRQNYKRLCTFLCTWHTILFTCDFWNALVIVKSHVCQLNSQVGNSTKLTVIIFRWNHVDKVILFF